MDNSPLRPTHAWSLIAMCAVAIISLFVNVQSGVVTAAAIIVGWWTWHNPGSSFLFLLVVSPLLPLIKFTQTIATITVLKDVLIITLFVRLVVVPFIRRELPYRRNIMLAPGIALALWTTVAALRSETLVLGILRAREIGLYAIVYLVALYMPATKKFWREAFSWLAATYVVVALLAMYQWVFADDSAVLRFDPARNVWIPRISSTFAHPSVFGQYLVLVASLFLPLTFLTRGRLKVASLVGALSTLPLIYLTYSRGVWLAFFTSIIGMVTAYGLAHFVTGRRIPWRVVAASMLGVVLVITALLAFTPVGTFILSSLDPTYRSNAIRLEFLSRLIVHLTNTDALIGEGLGDVIAQNFRQIEIDPSDIAGGESRNVQLAKDATLVDNQWLKTFVEMGLVGILVYVWLYWRVIRHSFSLIRLPLPARFVGLFGIAFTTAFIVQALFIDIWDIFPTNLAFWVAAAVISTSEQWKSRA